MGKTILLLLLIAITAAGGIVWFDYLGLVDVKTVLAPVYNFFGLEGRSQEPIGDDELLNLDSERLAVRLEALELRELEIEKQSTGLSSREAELAQIASELEERQKSITGMEDSVKSLEEAGAVRAKKVEQNARYLNGMPPANAVAIIAAMDDQEAIDVLRKTEEIAAAEGSASIVPLWLSMLQPQQRAADIMRKMTERPD